MIDMAPPVASEDSSVRYVAPSHSTRSAAKNVIGHGSAPLLVFPADTRSCDNPHGLLSPLASRGAQLSDRATTPGATPRPRGGRLPRDGTRSSSPGSHGSARRREPRRALGGRSSGSGRNRGRIPGSDRLQRRARAIRRLGRDGGGKILVGQDAAGANDHGSRILRQDTKRLCNRTPLVNATSAAREKKCRFRDMLNCCSDSGRENPLAGPWTTSKMGNAHQRGRSCRATNASSSTSTRRFAAS